MTLYQLKHKLTSKFTNSETPQLDADCILQHFLNCDRTFLLANREFEISSEIEEKILEAAEKRAGGLPIAYITGHKEFFGYDFFVTPDVLIPKPDTEILVEEAISAAMGFGGATPLKICDMCTGSGCVGISVALELEKKGLDNLSYTFIDISDEALAVTAKNVDALVPENLQKNIQLVKSDLFEAVKGTFNIIVTNPPYIPTTEAKDLLKDGRNEPWLALDGGDEDGLSIIKRLVPQAAKHLEKNGILLMETGEYNAEATADIFRENGFFDVDIVRDLSGQLRVVRGVL